MAKNGGDRSETVFVGRRSSQRKVTEGPRDRLTPSESGLNAQPVARRDERLEENGWERPRLADCALELSQVDERPRPVDGRLEKGR
jgi:hypothetical protein